jgi:hypothetical protein
VRVTAAAGVFAMLGSGCAFITRTSTPTGGAPEANGTSGNPALAMDGRFAAFVSTADNLVAGDTNAVSDVFVKDHQTGVTTRVSVSSAGGQANGASKEVAISGNGNFVAFSSAATNLVPGDGNGVQDVFVHNRTTGATARISVNAGGFGGNAPSGAPTINGSGQFVAFQSDAANLVPGDANGASDVFLFDAFGALALISVNGAGVQGNGASTAPSIDAIGNRVAFESDATNLVPGDGNGVQDIFVHDVAAAGTARASVSTAGAQAVNPSADPSISRDGLHVAFHSDDFMLVPGFANGFEQVYVRSFGVALTVPVSVDPGGGPGNDDSTGASMGQAGQWVAYESEATDLVPGDTNADTDIFLWNRVPNLSRRISLDRNGVQSNDDSIQASLSGDMRYVAFASAGTNLVPADTNLEQDVFTRYSVTPVVNGVVPAVAPQGSAPVVFINGFGFLPGAQVLVGNAGVVATAVVVFNETTILATFNVAIAAPLGASDVIVRNPGGPWSPVLGGAAGTCAGCFTVA